MHRQAIRGHATGRVQRLPFLKMLEELRSLGDKAPRHAAEIKLMPPKVLAYTCLEAEPPLPGIRWGIRSQMASQ